MRMSKCELSWYVSQKITFSLSKFDDFQGLCKCASAGGDDTARATMKEGATLKLAHTCKKFLLDHENYSVDVRRLVDWNSFHLYSIIYSYYLTSQLFLENE